MAAAQGEMWVGLRACARSLVATLSGVFLATVLWIMAIEIILRVVAYFWYDHSKYYLFFGLHRFVGKVEISPWHTWDGRYYKFPSNYLLHGAAGQGTETATTNSLGFRGRDFLPSKPRDTFRIFCLGGSSTFGFHNGDDETYPHYLQSRLNAAARGMNVEVINAGFPYYNTGSIVSLLENELLRYSPDMITLYTGYNDTEWPLEITPLFWAVSWIQQHSIAYTLLKDKVLTKRLDDVRVYLKLVAHLRRKDEREGRDGSIYSRGAILKEIEEKTARYRSNLGRILRIAKENGVRVILVKQPMSARAGDPRYEGLSYEEEVARAEEKFRNGENMSRLDIILLQHHRLMGELQGIADSNDIPLVDNIAIVDRDRKSLASFVHLTATANMRLAEALQGAIQPFLPGPSP